MSRRPSTWLAAAGELPGLDPTWSRRLDVVDADGIPRTWHLLERPAEPTESPAGTMLCLHGNPTWSYLWRRFLAAAPPGWRVIAPDQLGMGWSERLDRPRTLAERIDDLGRLPTPWRSPARWSPSPTTGAARCCSAGPNGTASCWPASC